jgi:hypothetical protein
LLQETKESLSHLLHDKDASALRTALENDVLGLGTILKGGPTLGLTGVVNLLKMTSSEIASPFETVYWSMVPYRLGDPPHKQKIKFRAKFCPPKVAATKPANPSPNFLRETMIKQLAAGAGPRQFDFEVQRGTADMSVENSTVLWKEEAAPFIKVAISSVRTCRSRRGTPCRSIARSVRSTGFGGWSTRPSPSCATSSTTRRRAASRRRAIRR